MKTISKCFLYIAVMCPLTVINFFCLVFDIVAGDWKGAIMMLFSLVVGIWAIRDIYKRAKRIEEQMQSKIQSLINLQAFDLLRMTFEKRSDFNPKDKTDEVATDK